MYRLHTTQRRWKAHTRSLPMYFPLDLAFCFSFTSIFLFVPFSSHLTSPPLCIRLNLSMCVCVCVCVMSFQSQVRNCVGFRRICPVYSSSMLLIRCYSECLLRYENGIVLLLLLYNIDSRNLIIFSYESVGVVSVCEYVLCDVVVVIILVAVAARYSFFIFLFSNFSHLKLNCFRFFPSPMKSCTTHIHPLAQHETNGAIER